MQQAATTLTNMILVGDGGCNDHIQFVKNYVLVYGETKSNKNGETDLDPTLYQELIDYRPDICVFTAGAHFMDEGDLYTMLEELKTRLPPLRQTFHEEGLDMKFIWKVGANPLSPIHAYWLCTLQPQSYIF